MQFLTEYQYLRGEHNMTGNDILKKHSFCRICKHLGNAYASLTFERLSGYRLLKGESIVWLCSNVFCIVLLLFHFCLFQRTHETDAVVGTMTVSLCL